MAELKTRKTDQDVETFINSLTEKEKRQDSFIVLELLKKLTKEEPKIWGNGTVGFGEYHYKGKSGREGEWYKMGFSPRKQNLTFYSMLGFERSKVLLSKLGKYKTGVGCLYINKLSDVDMKVLARLLKEHAKTSKELKSVLH